MVLRERRQCRDRLADLAQHLPGRKVVGAEPRLVRLDEDWNAGRWHLDLDKLFDACDGRTKAMFLASPGNPTGWMLTAEEQKHDPGFRARARHRHPGRRSLWHLDL